MSFTVCKNCKHQVYCTFPSTGRVRECDEYEEVDTALAFDWDMKALLKLWPQNSEESSRVRRQA